MASSNGAAQDQSMEEILQSIKRIIADEETTPNIASPIKAADSKDDVAEASTKSDSADILELSDIIEDFTPPQDNQSQNSDVLSTAILTAADNDFSFNDNNPIVADTNEEVEIAQSNNNNSNDDNVDEDSTISDDSSNEAVLEMETLEVSSMQQIDNYMNNKKSSSVIEDNVISIEASTPAEQPSKSELLGDIDRLLSANAASGATSAFRALAQKAANRHPKPVEKNANVSSTTVEDLIIEFMRPMLQEWVNENLPQTVERIVKQEIRKLSESA